MKKSILLIISGSIAAYKSLDLIRRLRERDIDVRCILTKGGEQFITPLAVGSISGNQVYTELFSLKDEVEMGHIRLSREADLMVVAPASANVLARMAHGSADDLASATLLASNKPILVAPAMNTQMWNHPATQRNIEQLKKDGHTVIEPGAGTLACGEVGSGRMADIDVIVEAVTTELSKNQKAESVFSRAIYEPQEARNGGVLKNLKALVTSGPTYEAIDPVRFIGNRSSGKQGHAIALALAEAGADVTLISGPTALPDPLGVTTYHVTSADEMLAACEKALPAHITVCAAAVADWKPSQPSIRKLKKINAGAMPELHLIENPDILAFLSTHATHRPKLVIGFAAETETVKEHATRKLKSKSCDWIVANDVSGNKAFNLDHNEVMLVTHKGTEHWPEMSKTQIAEKLVSNIITHFNKRST
jgi:phosphopantothenoylcysteine decarboxylase / phosphopantothenate---cysteine ligase